LSRAIVESIEAEFRRYKALGEGAMNQLTDAQLVERASAESNSIAMLAWHMAGNFKSRFTDFLDTDGEKPWRDREGEFAVRDAGRDELIGTWNEGWDAVLTTVGSLTDAHLENSITIRGVSLSVAHALHRSLAHASYHVGQMVYIGKIMRGTSWEYQSIPPGGTAAYNQNPTHERGVDRAEDKTV
jgi:hypothetical protein